MDSEYSKFVNDCIDIAKEIGYSPTLFERLFESSNKNDDIDMFSVEDYTTEDLKIKMAIMKQRDDIFMQLLEYNKGYNLPDFKVRLNKDPTNKTHPSRLLEVAAHAEENLDNVNGFVLNIIKNCKLKNLLVLKKPFLDYSDEEGANILHIMSLFGRNDVILWLLLEKEYDVFSTDKSGNTALYYAAENKQLKTIILLLMFGLNYENIKAKESKDFNNIVPFIDQLRPGNIKSLNEVASLNVLSNFLKSLDRDTLISFKTKVPDILKLLNELKTSESMEIEVKSENLILEIFAALSHNEYIVQYEESINDDGLFKLGILTIDHKNTNKKENGLKQLQDYDIKVLKTELENRKKSEIRVLAINRNFKLVIDKTNKLINVYRWKSNTDKFELHEKLCSSQNWFVQIKHYVLDSDNITVVKYNQNDETIDVFQYKLSGNDVIKENILENKKLSNLKLEYETNLERIVYLLTSDKRFLILSKLQDKNLIYTIDLTNKLETGCTKVECEFIEDIRIIENSYCFIVKSARSVKLMSLVEYGNNTKLGLIENINLLSSCVIDLKYNFLFAIFNDHIDIHEIEEKDKKIRFIYKICFNDSGPQSKYFLTSDRNHLLYTTESPTSKKYTFHDICLTDEKKESEIMESDSDFCNFHSYNRHSALLTNKRIPYILEYDSTH